MTEIWKDIPGYEGYYQASNMGRIKSVEREILYSNGMKKTIKEKILKNTFDGHYMKTILSKDGFKKQIRVHRLVLLSFKGDNKDTMINHIDGNKLNNKLDNLEWSNAKDNTLHAFQNNLIKTGIPITLVSECGKKHCFYSLRNASKTLEIPKTRLNLAFKNKVGYVKNINDILFYIEDKNVKYS